MKRRRDPETGQFESQHSPEEILDLLSNTRLATSEVSERLEYHRSTVYEKLRELEKKDLVKSNQVGNTIIWERVD